MKQGVRVDEREGRKKESQNHHHHMEQVHWVAERGEGKEDLNFYMLKMQTFQLRSALKYPPMPEWQA